MTPSTLDLRSFLDLCRLHPNLKIERNKEGELIIMPPTGGGSGNRNSKLTTRLEHWAEADGTGLTFDSSTEFRLPNGGNRSPDAAWIHLEK
ncbi:MAG: Uma2 family endonuclease [Chroococcidiopsidaceae cyanobacterium CP_BM_ER_R8_30]|nr:Uma2 family endonuclease [Chroococcidiopsidaceae cyanobacterium CP_BM_ER_R8_30]